MRTFTLKVIEKKFETVDSVTFSFKQPLLKKIKYTAGQYITLCLTVNGRKYRRPYSFSSSPTVDRTLDITIKRVPNGIISNYMIDNVEVGHMIEILEPMGKFVLPTDVEKKKEIFLWAAGSGITPLYSLLKTILKEHPAIHVNLINCARKKNEVIFYNELQQLQEYYWQQFFVFYYFSQEKGSDNQRCCFSRVSSQNIDKVLHAIKSKVDTLHYICGPQWLIDLVKDELMLRSVSDSQIYTEEFDHVVNDSDLKGIESQSVKLRIDNQVKEITVPKGQSILDAGLDQQLDLPYSCQNGTCTLCKGVLQKGELKTINKNKPETALTDNEYLLCCSYPLNSQVELIVK